MNWERLPSVTLSAALSSLTRIGLLMKPWTRHVLPSLSEELTKMFPFAVV